MFLSRDDLKRMILEKNLVSSYGDLDGQLTPNGIDLRLAALIEIAHGGKLAVDRKNNKNPKLGSAFILKGFEDRLDGYDIKNKRTYDPGYSVKLLKHVPYFAITCEKVDTPNNLLFHIAARTSLFRLCQAELICTVGEAGYKGYLAFIIMPFMDAEIELGVRFSQLSFAELTGEANYNDQKEVNQQGGKLFSVNKE